jgi:hypothetical protein
VSQKGARSGHVDLMQVLNQSLAQADEHGDQAGSGEPGKRGEKSIRAAS